MQIFCENNLNSLKIKGFPSILNESSPKIQISYDIKYGKASDQCNILKKNYSNLLKPYQIIRIISFLQENKS